MNSAYRGAPRLRASHGALLRAGRVEVAHTSPDGPVHRALFAPLHYEPNYAYPLLIWLHGPGGDERQLLRVMPLISLRNYVAVSPRGTREQAGRSPGYYWGDDEVSLAEAERRIAACLEAARTKYHINPDAVFLAGLQCGGVAAFRVALQRPEWFAGVLSIGGPFPRGGRPLAELPRARRLPLFIAQGRDSRRYDVQRVCDDLRLLHAAGLAVTLRQYPCGDELDSLMLRDMDAWIMERVTGVAMSQDEPERAEEPPDQWN